MPLYITPCDVCRESIKFDLSTGWVHLHTGDRECWTGDGAVADSRLSPNNQEETP